MMKNFSQKIFPFSLVLIQILSLLVGGCSGKKVPDPLPSQSATQVTPQLEPPPQLPPPIRQIRPTRPSTVKVIDPGGDPVSQPKSLYEASQHAKALKSDSAPGEAVVEINDDNLHEYAEKAEIIMLVGEPAAPPISTDPSPSSSLAETLSRDARDEQYWRNGVLKIRMNWRRTLDRIDELELESAALRQQFYAEEDPYIRDSHIKPDWDRVLDRLRQLRDRSGRYSQELEQFIAEGRRAEALPGWLSEGWELEPEQSEVEQAEADAFAPHQAGEPQIVNEVIDPNVPN